jgi:hypothetical protein
MKVFFFLPSNGTISAMIVFAQIEKPPPRKPLTERLVSRYSWSILSGPSTLSSKLILGELGGVYVDSQRPCLDYFASKGPYS